MRTTKREFYWDLLDRALTKKQIEVWNTWRRGHSRTIPYLGDFPAENTNLSGADFSRMNWPDAQLNGANLDHADFRGSQLREARLAGAHLFRARLEGARLPGADLQGAFLANARLRGATLTSAHFNGANLAEADLRGADLRGAEFEEAVLVDSDLRGANLTGANLRCAMLVRTKLQGAKLRDADVYGASVWDIVTDSETVQQRLEVDYWLWRDRKYLHEVKTEVDSLQAAQFIGSFLRPNLIRDVLDSSTRRVVLILSRFNPRRKRILDELADELTKFGYLPLRFDFPKPKDRDFTETGRVLAGFSRFIVADVTQPQSIPLELQSIVPGLMVPVVPIIERGNRAFSMFRDLEQKYPWVLQLTSYRDAADLRRHAVPGIIRRAEQTYRRIQQQRKDVWQKPQRIGAVRA